MRSVTSADIVRVAQKYCTFANMSLIEYVPKRVGEGASSDGRLKSLKKRIDSRSEVKADEVAIPQTPPPIPLHPIVMSNTPLGHHVECIPLGGGVTLLYLQNSALPLASTAVYFPGGRLDETIGTAGLTQFALQTSLKGTERRSADEITFEMESLGSSIHVESSADLFGYSMNVLSKDFEKGLDLLSDIVLNPSFPPGEIEKEKTSALARLKRLRDDMFRYPIELFYKAMFGLHPYGLPRNGTPDSVATFSRDRLAHWYAQAFQFRHMVITVVGDIERERAIEVAKSRLGVAADQDAEPRAQIYPVVPARGIREECETRDRQQTGMAIGFNGVGLRDDRFYALEVLRNVLAGMGGRLFTALREDVPLAYTVTAFNMGLLRGGAFFTYIATSPENEAEAKRKLLHELTKLRSKKISEAELRMSKAFCQGSHAMGMQGNHKLAYVYLHQAMIGRGAEEVAQYDARIEAVTADAVMNVAQDIIDPEQCAVGVVRGVKG
jgi:zinc protease